MKKFITIITAVLATTVVATGASASSVTTTVDAKSAVYGPGILPRSPGSLAPVAVDVTGLSQLTILSTGMTAPLGSVLTQDADGFGASFGTGDTTINGLNGVSGITVEDSQLFLAGVFVDSANLPTTGTGPASLSYTGFGALDFLTSYSILNQTFFIGDGLTSGLVAQKFNVSAGADTLLLGFVDGFSFNGAPGYYEDNIGSLSTTVAPVPLPAAGVLLFAGLGAIGALRRR